MFFPDALLIRTYVLCTCFPIVTFLFAANIQRVFSRAPQSLVNVQFQWKKQPSERNYLRVLDGIAKLLYILRGSLCFPISVFRNFTPSCTDFQTGRRSKKSSKAAKIVLRIQNTIHS